VWRRYHINAKARGLVWELTEEQFDFITASPCHYCRVQPQTISEFKSGRFVYNGIDRKNTNLGYTLANVVPCCFLCNHAKGTTPYGQFITWLKRFYA